MWVNDCFFENLPFPYLLVKTENKWIVDESLLAKTTFPSKPSFLDLIEPSYQYLLDEPFKESNCIELTIPLLTLKNQYSFYRIYCYKEMEQLFHVFVLPNHSQLKDIENVLDKIESKFSIFQQEIKDNKQFIDQTVMELHEVSVANQHYQNIEKLAAGIAHEIRNPITTVRGFIQLLKPHLIDIGKEQYANIALEELNRANELIYEFLNASKPLENQWQTISLNNLVKETSILYESEAILKDISIVNQFDEDIEIWANQKQLKQVLVNLLKNAMEAIEERHDKSRKGIIHFYTFCENGNVSVVVKDNGCGMSEKTLQNLFLPFHTTKESGTGVGLSVCKKIIDDHNGKIIVESSKGSGTKFRLSFPLQKNSQMIREFVKKE